MRNIVQIITTVFFVVAAFFPYGCDGCGASIVGVSTMDSGIDTTIGFVPLTDTGPPPEHCDAGTQFDGWRFAVFGDSRDSGETGGHNALILGDIVAAVIEEDVDLIVFPGDLVSGSGDPDIFKDQLLYWLDTTKPLYEAGIPIYFIRGNHDIGSLKVWNEVFSDDFSLPDSGPEGEENLTYAVEHENALFLAFDLYVNFHRVNQAWLDEQLAQKNAEHIFAFAHEPAYHAIHQDCMDDFPEERDIFWRSLDAAGSRLYFACHDHFYGRALVRDGDEYPDMYQMIVATAGAPPYNFSGVYDGDNSDASVEDVFHDNPYGYILIEIDGPNARITWKKMVSRGVFEEVESFCYNVADNQYVSLSNH